MIGGKEVGKASRVLIWVREILGGLGGDGRGDWSGVTGPGEFGGMNSVFASNSSNDLISRLEVLVDVGKTVFLFI